MKIGIEGQRLFRKKKHGMDMVALELVRNLMEIDHENEYVVFVKKDEDPCLESRGNFRVVELESQAYPVWEQRLLPAAARSHGCDILHCTSNTAPIFCPVPLIVTVHDIIYMESLSLLKKGFSNYQKFGNLYRRVVVPKVIRKAKKVITVSEFEKQRIASFFGLDGQRLVAVYNGVSSHFRPVTDPSELERIRSAYRLPSCFAFFFGNTDPKKNTIGVLKALSLFNTGTDDKLYLVMLDYDREELLRLLNEISDPGLIDYIVLTGYVPNKELPGIYSLASVFLYPSLRESFGIPMLEGMLCGVPVITSNTSSMPEVGGDAALFIDPFRPEEITSAMKKILGDSSLRADLARKGLINAGRFSWKTMAEKMLEIYKETYNNL
jgi:glycosyltransferase involved in cell wall biosynthesis